MSTLEQLNIDQDVTFPAELKASQGDLTFINVSHRGLPNLRFFIQNAPVRHHSIVEGANYRRVKLSVGLTPTQIAQIERLHAALCKQLIVYYPNEPTPIPVRTPLLNDDLTFNLPTNLGKNFNVNRNGTQFADVFSFVDNIDTLCPEGTLVNLVVWTTAYLNTSRREAGWAFTVRELSFLDSTGSDRGMDASETEEEEMVLDDARLGPSYTPNTSSSSNPIPIGMGAASAKDLPPPPRMKTAKEMYEAYVGAPRKPAHPHRPVSKKTFAATARELKY